MSSFLSLLSRVFFEYCFTPQRVDRVFSPPIRRMSGKHEIAARDRTFAQNARVVGCAHLSFRRLA